MGNNERARQAQFEILVSYMERHGDLQYLSDKVESQRRWFELEALLNDKSIGEPKSLEKWRKCWSDFKNNTKKKHRRIKRNDCRVDLSSLEKRVMKLIEEKLGSKRKKPESDSENTITFKAESVQEEDSCEMPPSPASPDPVSPSPVSPSPCFVRDVQFELVDQRKPSTSSEDSDEELPTPEKRKKILKDNKDVADKYLDFEREREKLAHEREMARIKQSDQIISIFGKLVNVLETLTPSIQKYLNRDTKR